MVPELIKKCPDFQESEISLPSSLWLCNGPYHKPAESSPHHNNCLWRDTFYHFKLNVYL